MSTLAFFTRPLRVWHSALEAGAATAFALFGTAVVILFAAFAKGIPQWRRERHASELVEPVVPLHIECVSPQVNAASAGPSQEEHDMVEASAAHLAMHDRSGLPQSGVAATFVLEVVWPAVVRFLGALNSWRARPAGRLFHSLVSAGFVCGNDAGLVDHDGGAAELFALLDGRDVSGLAAAVAFEHVWADPRLLQIRDCAGRSLLMKAAQQGSHRVAAALLAARADPNARGGNGWTALHFAAVGMSPEMCTFLVSRGADVESSSADGYPPIFYAHRAGADANVVQLRSCGAKPCHRNDRWGFTDTGFEPGNGACI